MKIHSLGHLFHKRRGTKVFKYKLTKLEEGKQHQKHQEGKIKLDVEIHEVD